MPRFVILEHDHPERHWDLMLEDGAALRTWRLSGPPGEGPVSAEPSFDHRLMYLDYEGPVSGGRGRVVRWDGGTFAWRGREEGLVVVALAGQRGRGVLRLERTGPDAWRASWQAEGPSGGGPGGAGDRQDGGRAG